MTQEHGTRAMLREIYTATPEVKFRGEDIRHWYRSDIVRLIAYLADRHKDVLDKAIEE